MPSLTMDQLVVDMVMVPADGAKVFVPATVKVPSTIALLDVPEIVVLILRLP